MRKMKPWALWGLIGCTFFLLGMQEGIKPKEEAPASKDDEMVVLGRKYVHQFYNGQLTEVYKSFSSAMKESMSFEQFSGIREKLSAQLGDEQQVIGESTAPNGEFTEYRRLARFEKSEGNILVLWAMREDGSIGAFYFRPASGPSGG
jgi:hypothetical protein